MSKAIKDAGFTRSASRPRFEHSDGRTVRRDPRGGWQAFNADGSTAGARKSGLTEAFSAAWGL